MANRRTRSAAIRRSFAQGIRGSAAMPCCLTNPRAQRQRGSIGCDAPHAAGCEACINGGCLSASRVLKCAASRGAQKSALTEVVPALRRPRWSAPVRRRAPPKRLRDVDYAMRTQPRQDLHHKVSSTRPATPDLARPSAIDGGGCNPRSHRSRGLECPASTTARRMLCHLRYEFTGVRVSGCGTGHMHCGGQTGR